MIVKIIRPEFLIKSIVILLSAIILYININKQFVRSLNPITPSSAFYKGDYCPPIQDNWLFNKYLLIGSK